MTICLNNGNRALEEQQFTSGESIAEVPLPDSLVEIVMAALRRRCPKSYSAKELVLTKSLLIFKSGGETFISI